MQLLEPALDTDESSPVQQSGSEQEAPFRVVSFFAGCGGLDLGFLGGFRFKRTRYPKLPFRILKAYDFDEACAATYSRNIGDHFEVADLAKTKPESVPQADILIGGFPCQEFSICGPKGGADSKRGALYKAMVRYAAFHKPKLVVAENVAHLPRLNDGKDLRRITAAFSRAGYRSALWEIYAPDYGIPQARQRVVLIFTRKDIKAEVEKPAPRFTKSPRHVEWAIGDLAGITDESVPNQSQYFKAALAKSGNGQGDEVSPRDRPGYTVRANAKSRVQFHYELPRRLTVRECARLQTFPDSFVFPHAATTSVRQIGNAVPPMLGYEIAKAVRNFMNSIQQTDAHDEVVNG